MHDIIGVITDRQSIKYMLRMNNSSLSAYIKRGRNFTTPEAVTICALNKLYTPKPNYTDCSHCRFSCRSHITCPTIDVICNKCGKRNHWSPVCWQKSECRMNVNTRMNVYTIGEVSHYQNSRDEVFVSITIHNITLKAKVDTAAQAIVMP